MQQITTFQATPGMVLAKEVEISEGRVLCGKGTELTESLIERLKRMEIAHITVEGFPVPVEGQKSLKEEVLEVEHRFSKVKHIKPLMYLKKRIQERLIESRRQ